MQEKIRRLKQEIESGEEALREQRDAMARREHAPRPQEHEAQEDVLRQNYRQLDTFMQMLIEMRGAQRDVPDVSIRSRAYEATAYCSLTGVTGRSYGETIPEEALDAAIEDCISRGGVPECCERVAQLMRYVVITTGDHPATFD